MARGIGQERFYNKQPHKADLQVCCFTPLPPYEILNVGKIILFGSFIG